MKTKAKLPRDWKHRIHRLTGLHYCDSECGCGDNNQLWWFPPGERWVASWVPAWMNGTDSFEIWRWIVEHGYGG